MARVARVPPSTDFVTYMATFLLGDGIKQTLMRDGRLLDADAHLIKKATPQLTRRVFEYADGAEFREAAQYKVGPHSNSAYLSTEWFGYNHMTAPATKIPKLMQLWISLNRESTGVGMEHLDGALSIGNGLSRRQACDYSHKKKLGGHAISKKERKYFRAVCAGYVHAGEGIDGKDDNQSTDGVRSPKQNEDEANEAAKIGKSMTQHKACKILHDGEVRGHKLTDKQRKLFGAICSGYHTKISQQLESEPIGRKLTKHKACKILHDKSVKGHPLTEQQRKFFGAVCSGYARKIGTQMAHTHSKTKVAQGIISAPIAVEMREQGKAKTERDAMRKWVRHHVEYHHGDDPFSAISSIQDKARARWCV